MQMDSTFLRFCEGLNTPVSLSCWLLYKYNEHAQLASKQIEPNMYASADSFRRDYAAVKLLSKWKGLRTGIDTEAVALDKWITVERHMSLINTRLLITALQGFSPCVEAVLFTAKRKIASCLGNLVPNEILDGCRWGPGATFTLKGERATVADKLCEEQISVTSRALPYVRAIISDDLHWCMARFGPDCVGQTSPLRSEFQIVKGCRVTTVDKDAKTKRVIAIEPTGNVFFQLGIGRVIRRRLMRRGIDLDDQSRNKKLAEIGSKSGHLATVDLASASDSVSREVVWQLLPYEWASLLDDARSPYALVGNRWLELEKFSSMGNGFTFELETLIFWGVASAVCEVLRVDGGEVAVYGDDIIVPVEAYPLLIEVLDCLGFVPNKEKSFATGYFRESCGGHYWNGDDVTPIYQKEVLTDISEVYRFANRIISFAYRLGNKRRFASDLKPAWEDVVRRSPWEIQHFVPWGDDSDDGLKLPFGELLAVVMLYDSAGDRFKLPVLSFRAKRREIFDQASLLAYWLRFWPEQPFNGAVTVRRRGRYVPRRRWFYTYAHNDLSTVDVAWS